MQIISITYTNENEASARMGPEKCIIQQHQQQLNKNDRRIICCLHNSIQVRRAYSKTFHLNILL